jgi:hypothetical protein
MKHLFNLRQDDLDGSLPSRCRSTNSITHSLSRSLRFLDSELEFQFSSLEVIDDSIVSSSLNELLSQYHSTSNEEGRTARDMCDPSVSLVKRGIIISSVWCATCQLEIYSISESAHYLSTSAWPVK